MITEDYVNFETAKLLKEKGFNEYTEFCFVGEEWESPSLLTNSQLPDGRYSRPTLQMAMKWLREVHGIFIRIIQHRIEYCQFELYWNHGDYYRPNTFNDSYEEACEAAIKYCLENLI